jgi:hypothetical protein
MWGTCAGAAVLLWLGLMLMPMSSKRHMLKEKLLEGDHDDAEYVRLLLLLLLLLLLRPTAAAATPPHAPHSPCYSQVRARQEAARARVARQREPDALGQEREPDALGQER